MKSITHFIFEIETLKNIKRSGAAIARISHPDSIAEHVAIAAQIAFLLAHMEGASAEKCACILLFHDNAEIRIGDLNKIQARYLDSKEAEQNAHNDQIRSLPTSAQLDLQRYFTEFTEQKTKEAKICKDADYLELAFQSKIYIEQGYHAKHDWLNNIEKSLKTDSAKQLFEELKTTDSAEWWQGLKKL